MPTEVITLVSGTDRAAYKGLSTWATDSAGTQGGEDVHAASVGQLSVVYVANRLTRKLSVLGRLARLRQSSKAATAS